MKEPCINRVYVKIIPDYYSTSEDGEWTNDPYSVLRKKGLSGREINQCYHDGTVIDRANGDKNSISRGEYRYWVAGEAVCDLTKEFIGDKLSEHEANVKARKWVRLLYEKDYDRNNSYWQCVGIRACVDISADGRKHTYESGGLFGVEWGDICADLIRLSKDEPLPPHDRKVLYQREGVHNGKYRIKVRHKVDETNDYIKQIIKEEFNDLIGLLNQISTVKLTDEEIEDYEVVYCNYNGREI
jgi:hypothetical protein